MKRLVLLVGIPGSGKTTLAQRFISRGYQWICADEIRRELWGDAIEQKEKEKVFEIFDQRLDDLFNQGADIVVDNTNINPKNRAPILRRAAAAGYTDVQLWVLDVPLELCLQRNRERQRNVPDEIVANYHDFLQGAGKPRKHEGKIIIVRPGEKDFDYRFFNVV